MADVHTKQQRSYNMSRIKGKNTMPEMLVRKFLHANGFRYKLHDKKLPGKPDIVLPKYRTVIFVHGCFWHGHKGCKYYVVPKTKTEWWLNKINRNKANDEKAVKALKNAGWRIIHIWECDLKDKKSVKTLTKLPGKILPSPSMNFIDLFAGAGGLSEGFIRAGFKPIAHVEMDEAACYTLKTRVAYHYLKSSNKFDIYTSYLRGEITRKELYDKIPEELLNSVINLPIGAEHNPKIHKSIQIQLKGKRVDLIVGGPPCQAYSLVGRARSADGMKGDSRNYLYVQYANYLEKYTPKMFVFENVVGLKSAGKGIYLENMKRLFDKKGYHMKLFNVEANDFGVLQNRKRIVILGWRKDINPRLPDLEEIKNKTSYAVSEVLNDLPFISAGKGIDKFSKYAANKPTTPYLKITGIRNGIDILTQHVARPHTSQDKKIYRIAVKLMENKKRLNYNELPANLKTHKNRHSFFDRFKVVNANADFSHTVVAHIAKDGHYYIHPDIKQNRSITVREAARLQSFPDDFYFEGVKEGKNRTAAFKQIGNAVPPLMAKVIAIKLKKVL